MTKEEFNISLEEAIQKLYDELGDKLNAVEGDPFERLSKMSILMYQDSIEQAVRLVIDMLEKSGVVVFG